MNAHVTNCYIQWIPLIRTTTRFNPKARHLKTLKLKLRKEKNNQTMNKVLPGLFHGLIEELNSQVFLEKDRF